MIIFKYNLLKILKRMDEIFYKEGKISESILKEFCEIMLANPIASSTFVAMFDSCSNALEANDLKNKFYKLSRYIDKQIVYKASEVEIFKRYDRQMNKVYQSSSFVQQREILEFRSNHGNSNNVFDFSLLNYEKMEVELIGNHKQSYQFDPANLMIWEKE